MSHDTRALLARWFDEVWNQNRLEAMDELMTSNAVAHGFPSPNSPLDATGFKEAVRQFHQTFSNIHISMKDLLVDVDGHKAAVRWEASITHAGEGLGFAPTQETVAVSGISIVRMENGKIAEGWDAFDLTQHIVALRQVAQTQADMEKARC